MGNVFKPSKAPLRMAEQQAAEQRRELARQRGIAENQQAASLQDTLENETNRLARVFGTRALLAGTGTRATVR
ncbi:hypothetical protein DC522_05895 [Microvirga sp. KLBC 81]|uniref:hypothetical protein n=1 Tax=Microvirga sp. KLBC 81 TaxID=1862707 RepID=UPI000D51A0A9|nr:hypothetical protein [Microvirga sp. KLBC 81]PVE25425.1 hypothetical protein DC522_05895 [Microvirga sp. KLBC 81]